MRIALTGSSGKLGSVAVRELTAAGHEVIGLDRVGERGPGFVRVDLTDYGQVVDALSGVDRSTGFDADAFSRKWNLWGYIDARDGAHAIDRALDAAAPGFESFIIAAADTVMTRSNAELVAEVFPTTPVHGDLGEHDTMLSIAKARRLLGFEPRHSWRDGR